MFVLNATRLPKNKGQTMDTDHLPDIDQIVSSLKTVDLSVKTSAEEANRVGEDLHRLLTSADGVRLLKQHNQVFDVILPLFTKILFHPDPEISRRCIQHTDVVLEVFRSKIPKIKKSGWWEKFELGLLIELISQLENRISSSDDSWVQVWIFIANIIINDVPLSTKPLNKLLSISESAFKKGRSDVGILDKAWKCWVGLIDAFGRSPKILVPSRTLCLLTKPLFACTNLSRYRVSTWARLIEVKGNEENAKQLVESMCKAMYKSGEKSMGRHHPDDCTEALIKIVRLDFVVHHCLPEIIDVFGACINTTPSGGLIEQLAGVLLQAINATSNDSEAYKLWRSVIDQCKSCTESPIVSQACQIFFTDVNFLRWVDSRTVKGKEVAQLMPILEFREKVLLRCIKSFTEDVDNCRKKPGKGAIDEVWSNYCDAYILWWSNQNLPSQTDADAAEAISHSCENHDVQAVQCLLLLPMKHNFWSPAVCKTWTLLCEASHNFKLLHLMVRPLLDALLEDPQFQALKTIDVLSCLFGLDSSFCKLSVKLLDTLASTVHSLEVKNVMDVLNLLEIVALFPEMNSTIGKIIKFINDKCSDFDQLNIHKIRTKVGKISRKLEQLSNLAETEKPSSKAQRTPFRTQSNFLQRLAKAEEKNKTKSLFLTSIFSNTEKTKTAVENGEEPPNGEVSMNTPQENTAELDDGKKPQNLDDTENVPIILLPPLKCVPPNENSDKEKIVAEKENVILSNATVAPTITSPACKLKITNVREVKIVDASSPVHTKKLKPAAGQKTTPKKVTPSKVSYFDDDANDCVMVPPKPKITPLTEHQMEVMSKRRADIPALYQDLSQDTQHSQPPSSVIHEITSGASPARVSESQDPVHRTPSVKDSLPVVTTPEHPNRSARNCSTAKKLDFNGLSSPSENSPPYDSLAHEISPAHEDKLMSAGNVLEANNDGVDVMPSTGDALIQSPKTPEKSAACVKEDAPEEKCKRKRKAEPTKFSPKQTRSKKKVKSSTPDSKLTKFHLPDQEMISVSKSPELPGTVTKSKPPESESPTNKFPPQPVKSTSPKSLEPTSQSSDDFLESSLVETDDPDTHQQCVSELKSVSDNEVTVTKPDNSNTHQDEEEPIKPLNDPLRLESERHTKDSSSKEKTARTRKRKNDGSFVGEPPKKLKAGDDAGGSSSKKSDPLKKKKIFKLGCANNLENWLLKTERIPSTAVASDGTIEKAGSVEAISIEPSSDSLPGEGVDDLDSSEEIVPSTQESSVENSKTPLIAAVESKVGEKCSENGDLDAKEEKDLDDTPAPGDASSSSPEKPEGSMLERLARESPNDDDIELVISPSKRLRRAPSVFRGEGDTYLTKEKFFSENSEEAEDESKAPVRGRNKTSPSTRKTLHPPSGRSAKMLRLAANSTSQSNENVGVTTPIRRRESIVPFKYGENWPKGHTEDWVACTPVSPFASPFRSSLKKTPVIEDNKTPQRGSSSDSKGSPLLSSAKRKRVVFLDPPVTRGLIYDLGNGSTGSIHHADIPNGSPYPIWKNEEDGCSGVRDALKRATSPPKAVADRLDSVDLKPELNRAEATLDSTTDKSNWDDPQGSVPSKLDSEDVADTTKTVDPPETTIVPSQETDLIAIKEKFNLPEDFMTRLEELDARIRGLIVSCFDCPSMVDLVDTWTLGDCRELCRLPHSFLTAVRNPSGELLTDVLAAAVFTVPSGKAAPQLSETFAQTETPRLTENSMQTQVSLVHLETRTAETNTVHTTRTSSSQADLELPSTEDMTILLKKIGRQRALLFFSDSLRLLSSLDTQE